MNPFLHMVLVYFKCNIEFIMTDCDRNIFFCILRLYQSIFKYTTSIRWSYIKETSYKLVLTCQQKFISSNFGTFGTYSKSLPFFSSAEWTLQIIKFPDPILKFVWKYLGRLACHPGIYHHVWFMILKYIIDDVC